VLPLPAAYLRRPPLPENDLSEPLPPSLLSMSLNDGAGALGRKDRDPLPRVAPLKDLSDVPCLVMRPLFPLPPLVRGGWNALSCVRGAMNGFPLEPPPPLPRSVNDRSGAFCIA